METPNLICIVGPTASGKSALAVSLAKALNGEVISADSMQIYRGMNIGTAKVTEAEMDGVVHHGIDVLEPEEKYNAFQFQSMARNAIEDVLARGKMPILCGGTGFFVHSVLYPMGFTEAEVDEDYRAELTARARMDGVEVLHQELAAIDPVSAERIHANNVKRVIRALEVYHLTGKPMSSFDEGAFEDPKPLYDPLMWIGLQLPRETLIQRINVRVDRMMEEGLKEEVRGLWDRGLRPESHTAMQGIGYKQFAPWLEGRASLQEAVERVKIETRQFAKRQMSWFRREKDIHWLEAEMGTEALTKLVLEEMER